jgi:hypothetical protein
LKTKIEKNLLLKIWLKIKKYNLLSLGLQKRDVLAIEEAFGPQKRTSSTAKHEIA